MLIFPALISCASGQKKTESSAAPDSVRKRIAILDLKPDGISTADSRRISELIRTDFINTGRFSVIERSQIEMIFREHGFNQIGVTDQGSAVKVGRLLAVEKILIGTAMRLGESTVITGRIVDMESGAADHGAKISIKSTEDIISAVSDFTEMLVGKRVARQSGSSSEQNRSTSPTSIRADKKIYQQGEDIVVTFSNFPGTKWDYISIAKKSASARDHVVYLYTKKQIEGMVTFYRGVYDPGEYEIRAHTEYVKGNQSFQKSYPITVKKK